jgi:tetratricopeptide (TPR) repeat protein
MLANYMMNYSKNNNDLKGIDMSYSTILHKTILMKNILLFTLFFFQLLTTYSQDQILDSINTVLDSHKTKDSIRVKNLLNAKSHYIYRNLDKTFSLIDEALVISKEIGYKKGEVSSLSAMSDYFIFKGEHDVALETVLKARKIVTSLSDKEELILINSQIAVLYTETGKYQKAVLMLLEIIKLMENKPNTSLKARYYFSLGDAYHKLKNFKKSEFYFNQTLKICVEAKDEVGAALTNGSLGNLYNDQGNYKNAVNKLTNTLQVFKKVKNNAGIAGSYFSLARSYRGLNKVDLAIEVNLKAIDFYKNQNSFNLLKKSYKNQSEFYELQQKYKESNEYLKKYYTVVDSIFNKEKTKAIEEIQVKYETEKTKLEKETIEQQVIIAKLESKKNKNLFLGSLLIAALIGLLALFYFSRLKTKKEAEFLSLELKEAQKRLFVEKQSRDSELKALKAQMNPHFMFNALNSIQDLVLKQDTDASYDYIVLFAELIRNTLNYSNKEFIPIEKELEFLKVYLQLEKLRFGDSFNYTISYDENENIEVPSLLIQPFIENALVHGLMHKSGKKELEVILSFNKGILKCTIIDNGIGRKKAIEIGKRQGNNHESFALNAIKKRLDIFSKNDNQNVGYDIEDLYENHIAIGTKVVVVMPFKKRF